MSESKREREREKERESRPLAESESEEVDDWLRRPLLVVEHFVPTLQSYAGNAGLEGEDRGRIGGREQDVLRRIGG